MLFLVLLSGCVGFATAGSGLINTINCTGAQPGQAFFGCKAAHICNGNSVDFVECGFDEAFDEQSSRCVPQSSVNNPCSLDDLDLYEEQCASMEPGPAAHRFPIDFVEDDLPCQYFFVCWHQQFMGVQKCQGGVFDVDNQYCSSPERVPPPCGRRPERN